MFTRMPNKPTDKVALAKALRRGAEEAVAAASPTIPGDIEEIRVRGARVHNLKNIDFDDSPQCHHSGDRRFGLGQVQPGV